MDTACEYHIPIDESFHAPESLAALSPIAHKVTALRDESLEPFHVYMQRTPSGFSDQLGSRTVRLTR